MKRLHDLVSRARYRQTMPALLLLDTASSQRGVAHPRTAPEWSDVALFVLAVAAVWLTRRALRRRSRKD